MNPSHQAAQVALKSNRLPSLSKTRPLMRSRNAERSPLGQARAGEKADTLVNGWLTELPQSHRGNHRPGGKGSQERWRGAWSSR